MLIQIHTYSHAFSVHDSFACCEGGVRSDAPYVRLVGGMCERLPLRLTLSGRGAPERGHPEAADLRAVGRRGRRSDDVAAGMDRRKPELGLPLLLAAGRGADDARIHRPRPATGSRGVPWWAV